MGCFVGRLLLASLFLMSGALKVAEHDQTTGGPVVTYARPKIDAFVGHITDVTGQKIQLQPVGRGVSQSHQGAGGPGQGRAGEGKARRACWSAGWGACMPMRQPNCRPLPHPPQEHYQMLILVAAGLELLGGALFVLNIKFGAVLLVRCVPCSCAPLGRLLAAGCCTSPWPHHAGTCAAGRAFR